MPNWCSNTVTFKGKLKDLRKIKTLLKDNNTYFSFNKVNPLPPNASIEDVYEAWGTKWNTQEAYIGEDIPTPSNTEKYFKELNNEEDPTDKIYTLSYTFDTAWSPPIPVIETLSEKFPEVYIELYACEEGCGIHFQTEYFKNGLIREINLPLREYDPDGNELEDNAEYYERVNDRIESTEGYLSYENTSKEIKETLGLDLDEIRT